MKREGEIEIETEQVSSENDESSLSSEEDENAEAWTESAERCFFKTLCSLKKKDPKIYDESADFFKGVSIQQNKKNKKKEPDPMFLRDYERKIILEKGGVFTDEYSSDEHICDRNLSPTYIQEQKVMKEGFKKFIHKEESDEEDFLKIKQKTQEQKDKEEADYVEWLKGQKIELSDEETRQQLQYLRDYWTDPDLNENEQFLRDYILDKKYLQPHSNCEIEDPMEFSEEEEMLQQHEEYEHNYNYRFEEPDKDFIKTYPRTIESSYRRKEEKRKEKREQVKARKLQKLEVKRIEVKKLKKLKKKELMENIAKIKEITGNELPFEMDGNFSPTEYDEQMRKIFSEEFYNVDDDEKPQFSDTDSLNCDGGGNVGEGNFGHNYKEDADFIMDCDYNPDAEKRSKLKTRSSRKKGHKRSTFGECMKGGKPVFDPEDKTYQQYLDEYYNLDFEDVVGDIPCRFKYRKVTPNSYGLTVEEILAADEDELKKWCPMKKIDTIRSEREEKFDLKIYSKRGKDVNAKKKFLPSLFQQDDMEKCAVDEDSATDVSQKLENLKTLQMVKSNKRGARGGKGNKRRCSGNERGSSEMEIRQMKKKHEKDSPVKMKSGRITNEKSVKIVCRVKRKRSKNENDLEPPLAKQVKKSDKNVGDGKKNCNQQRPENESGFKKATSCITPGFNNEISDERLKAYGFNPKKYKNKLKYGPK